jgi:hypothetical protein
MRRKREDVAAEEIAQRKALQSIILAIYVLE